jgi:hypothetical protein
MLTSGAVNPIDSVVEVPRNPRAAATARGEPRCCRTKGAYPHACVRNSPLMGRRAIPMNPPESAALTRLVIAYCLGRGSLCLGKRTLVLQLYHPARFEEYAFYQWRRVRRFLPACKPPRLHEHATGRVICPDTDPIERAQWRLRASSVHLRTAMNLLYPLGSSRGLEITSDALSLVDTEAAASLWADRGRLLKRQSSSCAEGRLNLSRFSFGSAATIAQWLSQLTGSQPILAPSPRYPTSPMLFFDHSQMARFLGALGETWMASAPGLAVKFSLPAAIDMQRQLLEERLARYTPLEAEARGEIVPDPLPMPRLRVVSGPRLAPTLPPEIPAPRQ